MSGYSDQIDEANPDGAAKRPWYLNWRRWDVLLALLVFLGAYALTNGHLRVGPVWFVPAVMVALLTLLVIAFWRERHHHARVISVILVAFGTLAIEASVVTVVIGLLHKNVDAPYLLRDAALLWIANTIIFAFWYWDLDGNGPRIRHEEGYVPTDLAFPQIALGKSFSEGWTPEFVDYLFVSFNASAAFSPTDTSFLSRRAKLLMMVQAMNSVVLLVIVAARAINTLG